MTEEETEISQDIVDEFDNTPEGELKQSMQEENLSDGDFDYNQGFGSNNYPESPIKDSITKFYREIISLMTPKKVVRVANFTNAEKKNAKICLSMAFYNKEETNNGQKSDVLMRFWEEEAVDLASVSMGHRGFIVQNIMTQRRIVQRQTDKPNPMAKNWSKQGQGKP